MKNKNMDMPIIAPKASPLKLVTMTIGYKIDMDFNLDVIAKYFPTSDLFPEVRYSGMTRFMDGSIVAKTKKITTKRLRKVLVCQDFSYGNGGFKNQCSIVVNIQHLGLSDVKKVINVKIFNNGKFLLTGCTKLTQVPIVLSKIIEVAMPLHGDITYIMPDCPTLNAGQLKNLHKHIVENLDQIVKYHTTIDKSIKPPEAYRHILDPEYLPLIVGYYGVIGFIYKYISELTDDNIEAHKDFFKSRFHEIIETHNPEENTFHVTDVPCTFSDKPFTYNESDVSIININNTCACNYFVDRAELVKLMNESAKNYAQFDPNHCTAVTCKICINDEIDDIKDASDEDTVTVLIFRSGSINITGTKKLETVDKSYHFICDLLTVNFDRLVQKNEYAMKKRAMNNNLPNVVVDKDDELHLYIRKAFISGNPRNRMILKQLDLYDKYRVATLG